MKLAAVLFGLGQQVALGTDGGLQGHHDFLADGVNRRIRDLGKELLEVVEEQLRPR